MASPEPSSDASRSITALLHALESGATSDAETRLWDLVFEELRGVATRLMRGERPGATLQPTALVSETYLRLFGSETPSWENRRHFFGAATRAMRQLLIERSRRHDRRAAGAGWQVTLQPTRDGSAPDRVADPVVLAESLDLLEQHDARAAQVVMLRFFAGLEHDDIARLVDVSVPTVKRDWAYGKSWLYAQLTGA